MSCVTNCSECGPSYSAYSETECYSLDIVGSTPPSTPLYLFGRGFVNYSSFGSYVYNPGYSVSGYTNFSGGDYVILPSNTLWKNVSSNTTEGPLNRCGISTTLTGYSPPYNVWIGFSQCINIPTTKTYYIGVAADNEFKLNIDGIEIVNTKLATPYWYGPGFFGYNYPFKRWNIYPLTLNSGNHILELYYLNSTNPSPGSFGCEVYDNTLSELSGATTYGDLNVIFTSSGKTQATIVQDNSGNYLTSGYTCSSGYVYNACTDECVKYEFCEICPEPPCPFETYCISTGDVLYDDTYYSAGTHNGNIYWTGGSSGYNLYYSTGDTQWCLSTFLDGPCELFGKSPCTNSCPDLCDEFFNPGICPSPTPSPTAACAIDFDAIFDCEVVVTQTPTPTPTPTITPTITPSSTNPCGGIGIEVSGITYTPTPTTTPTNTPSQSPEITRPCNVNGTVTFNTLDDYIQCPNSKQFKDCLNGFVYSTTNVVLDPMGYTPVIGMVYGATVNEIDICVEYIGTVDNTIGVATIVLNTEIGLVSEGGCLVCIPPVSSTPTPTPTVTPTITPSSTPSVCCEYQVTNLLFSSNTFNIKSCSTNQTEVITINGGSTITVKSYKVPVGNNINIVFVDCPCVTPTPTPSITPTNTVTPTVTPTNTTTPTVTPTNTVTPTITPTNTVTPTNTQTPTRTVTPTNTPTNTITPTNTVTPTNTSTPANSPTPTNTITPTNTNTPTRTVTPTVTPTNTQTPTRTVTPTPSSTPIVNPFISVWRTTSPSETINLPYDPLGTYSGTINWGDGNTSVNSYANRSHTYTSTGDYTVTITGTINGFSFSHDLTNVLNILRINQWGNVKISNTGNQFFGCSNLTLTTVTDIPNLTSIPTLQNMFFNCSSLSTINNINSWNVSGVTTMQGMFVGTSFNQDISSWNVSNVTSMGNMFGSSSFNQPIGSWNVSGVTNMSFMFSDTPFNQDISSWNVSNVTNMNAMFQITPFNQDISSWNVSGVTNMGGMFNNATSFNQDLSGWCVTLIPSLPSNFATGATAWVLPKPVWGTCPP